jgi:hypothetical protein
MTARRREPGPQVRALTRKLLLHIRQHIQTHGTTPRIDCHDQQLQHAWIGLGRHLERNAKVRRKDIHRELAPKRGGSYTLTAKGRAAIRGES